MAFTHRATATAIVDNAATSITITKPSGLAVGDLLVAVIGKDDDKVISAYPSGWTEAAQYNTALGNDVTSGIYYVVATSTQTAASDFTWTGDLEEWSGTITAFIPGNANPAFEGISVEIRRDGDSTPVSNALTTTAGNLIVGGCVAAQADTGGLGVATAGYTVAGNPTTGTSNGDNGSILAYDLSGAGGSLTIEFNNAESGAESHPWIFEFSDESAGLSLTPPLTQRLAVSFAPVVTTGSVTLTPPLTQRLAVSFAPVVTTSYTMTPGLTQRLAATFAPVVTTGSVALTPPLTQMALQTYALTVTTGPVTLTPPLTQRLAVTFAPEVTQVQALTPPLTQQLAVMFAPEVTTGPVALTPDLTQRLAVSFAPVVTLSGGDQTLTLGLTVNLAATFAPTVTTGAVALTPGLTQQLAVTFAPSVTTFQPITPPLTQRLAVTFAPTVTTGAVTVTLELVQRLAVTFPPFVTGGTLDLTAGHDTARFYRLGADRFALAVGLGRGGATPYQGREGWAPASGRFVVPLGRAPTPDDEATEYARTAWDDNKNENDATLYAAVNAALTAAGYTDSAGGEIT